MAGNWGGARDQSAEGATTICEGQMKPQTIASELMGVPKQEPRAKLPLPALSIPTNKHKLKIAILNTLVDGWQRDIRMEDCVLKVLNEIGHPISASGRISDEQMKYVRTICKPFISYRDTCRVYIARNFPMLSNALWEGRPRNKCILSGAKYFGLQGGIQSKVTSTFTVHARELSKRHDWKTVK